VPSVDPVLLDTHTVLWWQAASDRLSAVARGHLANASSILVSPISCWEIGMLVARGRVRLDRPTAAWTRDLLAADRVTLAELTASVAVVAAELPGFHGDPADRFLYASARGHGVPLLTKDRLIHRYADTDRTVDAIW
jgi:PIN domain nuclease of toxin-antitoxin system